MLQKVFGVLRIHRDEFSKQQEATRSMIGDQQKTIRKLEQKLDEYRVAMGGIVRNTAGEGVNGDVIAKYSVTLGPRDEQNAYTAELEAIALVLRCMPDGLRHRDVIIATRNRSALQEIAKPRQQSGQCTTREIYRHARRLEKGGNTIKMRWVSSTNGSFTLGVKAKAEARKATDSGCRATKPLYQARSTRLRVLLAQRRQHMVLPESVGSYSKQLDKAL
jgi:hypothetical protein